MELLFYWEVISFWLKTSWHKRGKKEANDKYDKNDNGYQH